MIDNGYDKQSVDKKNVNEPRNLEEIYELAYKYDEGDGVPVNKSEAVRLYRKAAEQGHAAAQYNLGCMYYNGDGVRQNYSEAMKWYNEAAKQGDLSAYHNIGVMFREGEGVRKDENEAVKWFTFAGKRGVENSINSLFELASKGNAEALFSLHFMYEHGDGVEQNYRESFFCLRKAAERGHTAAQVMLGNKYADENNMSEAARWYSDAVKQGDADAMYLLGHLYGSGEGVKQDLETATMLWVKAAQKGHEGARESLAKFEKMGLPRLW